MPVPVTAEAAPSPMSFMPDAIALLTPAADAAPAIVPSPLPIPARDEDSAGESSAASVTLPAREVSTSSAGDSVVIKSSPIACFSCSVLFFSSCSFDAVVEYAREASSLSAVFESHAFSAALRARVSMLFEDARDRVALDIRTSFIPRSSSICIAPPSFSSTCPSAFIKSFRASSGAAFHAFTN